MFDRIFKNNMDAVQQFVINAFEDRCGIPKDLEEFKRGFTNETTDGSLCYVHQFGEGENDVAMVFFYPEFCLVPERYRDNLKFKDSIAMDLVELNYQRMLIDNATIEDRDALQSLNVHIEVRSTMVAYRVMRSRPLYEHVLMWTEYADKYNSVSRKMRKKLSEFGIKTDEFYDDEMDY